MTVEEKIGRDFLCTELAPLPSPLSLSLPGGIIIERINLLEVIDPLLAPLMPVFRIVLRHIPDTTSVKFEAVGAVTIDAPHIVIGGRVVRAVAEAI